MESPPRSLSPSPTRRSPESYELAAKELEHEKQMVTALKRFLIGNLMDLGADPDIMPERQAAAYALNDDSSDSLLLSKSPSPTTSESAALIKRLSFHDAHGDTPAKQNEFSDESPLPATSLWVPANAHPEIDPQMFKTHVKNTIDELLERKLLRGKLTERSKRLSLSVLSTEQDRQTAVSPDRRLSSGNNHLNRYSNPSLRDLSSELEALTRMAGVDANDALSLARSLLTSSLGYTDVEKLAFDELGAANGLPQAEVLDTGMDDTRRRSAFMLGQMGYQNFQSRSPTLPQSLLPRRELLSPYAPLNSSGGRNDMLLKRLRRVDYRKAAITPTSLGSQLQSSKAGKLAELRQNLLVGLLLGFDNGVGGVADRKSSRVSTLSLASINPRSLQVLFSYRSPTDPKKHHDQKQHHHQQHSQKFKHQQQQQQQQQHQQQSRHQQQHQHFLHQHQPHASSHGSNSQSALPLGASHGYPDAVENGAHRPRHHHRSGQPRPDRHDRGVFPEQKTMPRLQSSGSLANESRRVSPQSHHVSGRQLSYPRLSSYGGSQPQKAYHGQLKDQFSGQPQNVPTQQGHQFQPGSHGQVPNDISGQRQRKPTRSFSHQQLRDYHREPLYENIKQRAFPEASGTKRNKSKELNRNLNMLRDEINEFKESLTRTDSLKVPVHSSSHENSGPSEGYSEKKPERSVSIEQAREVDKERHQENRDVVPDISFDITSHDVSYEDTLGMDKDVLKELDEETVAEPRAEGVLNETLGKFGGIKEEKHAEQVPEYKLDTGVSRLEPSKAPTEPAFRTAVEPSADLFAPKPAVSGSIQPEEADALAVVDDDSVSEVEADKQDIKRTARSDGTSGPDSGTGNLKEQQSAGPEKKKSKKQWLWSKEKSAVHLVSQKKVEERPPLRSVSTPEILNRKEKASAKRDEPNVISKLFKKKRSTSLSLARPSENKTKRDSLESKKSSDDERQPTVSISRSSLSDESGDKEESTKVRLKNKLKNIAKIHEEKPEEIEEEPMPQEVIADDEKPQLTLEVQEKIKKSIRRTSKANQPIEFTDSAFGFPLPPPSNSTLVMLDYRFPVHVERAIYRLSHLKLANPKRSLREQVLLSNFMYAYLNLVDHTLHLEQQMTLDDGGEFGNPDGDMDMFMEKEADTEFETDDDNDLFDAIKLDLDVDESQPVFA